MKNTLSASCLLLMATALFAQKNMVKFHFASLPTSTRVFSMGIGYERRFSEAWSTQLMFNHYGWDNRSSDGQAEITTNAVLEARRYLGGKNKEKAHQPVFVGCFVEGFCTKVLPGGEFIEPPPPLNGKRAGLGTGLVFGVNLHFLKTHYLELFAGPKFRSVWSEDYFGTADEYETYNAHQYTKLTVRLGCNIGFRF